MKKIFFLVFAIFFSVTACDKKSKVEKAVEEIPVQMKVIRFDQAFFESKPADLQNLKTEYPFFFPEGNDDVWIDKMQNPLWRELYDEVQKKYSNFGKQTTEIEDLFKHLKYYFPTIIAPTVYTVIGEMDYNTKAIYANDKLVIALELYLGKEHKFYSDKDVYLKQNFEERQMMPDIVSSFSMRTNPAGIDKSLLAEMIYYGKELYLKDILLPSYTDAEKIGYLPEQITWCAENESYMWRYFIDENLLFSSDPKLPSRFVNLAPFSKFYLEIDNETPGRVGQWIGWQIVRSFMKNNDKVTIQELLKMDAKAVFDRSKYKPKKE